MFHPASLSSLLLRAAAAAAAVVVLFVTTTTKTNNHLVVVAETALDQPFSSSFARLSHAACVTLFHRNGRVGCGTMDHTVQTGLLVYHYDDEDNNGGGGLPADVSNSPYVVVMEEWMVGQSIDTLLSAQDDQLKGILVLNSTNSNDGGSGSSSGASYNSPDSQMPRGYGTPSAGLNYGNIYYRWNPKGMGLLEKDLYGIPMAYVYDSDVSESLREEAKANGADNSIVAEFNYYMGPDNINSEDCLSWKDASDDKWAPKCLPLGGTSVWATLGSPPSNSNSNNGNDDNNNNNNNYYNNNQGGRPVVMLAAGMDSTSLFHDLVPGANTAASNILTMLMAAKLLGANVNDETLDALPKRIVLALFQGETYGFIGSRAFLRDVAYPGFECKTSLVPPVAKNGDDGIDYACLHPLRPSTIFSKLGNQIAGMISVDQVGHMTGEGVVYVHADENNDNYGAFVANIMKDSATANIAVASASDDNNNNNNNNNGYAYPPTPLTSLLSLTGGGIGGAILTGYDYAYTNKAQYHSVRDSPTVFDVNIESIAASSTILARSILAAAYDGGDYDYETAAGYSKNIIPELDADDETLIALADCLLYNGLCDLLKEYSSMDYSNERIRTGLNVGNMGEPFPNDGVKPNYYVGVYHYKLGQPIVMIGDQMYGGYDGDSEEYGKSKGDVVTMAPKQLESAIRNMMNDFLGRGSSSANGNGNQGDDGNGNDGGSSSSSLVSCKSASDCSNVNYCGSNGDFAVCSGSGVCVCNRAYYHVALDEALLPAANKIPGYFELNDENDQGISPMYTEPFWSNSVGIRVYRDVGYIPGFLTLISGITLFAASLFGAFVLKVGLRKERLY